MAETEVEHEFDGLDVDDAPAVGIVMGSKSDMPVMERAGEELEERGIRFEIRVMSAHRDPETVADYAKATQLLPFKGGMMGGEELAVEQITSLSKLPSRETLYGQLVGIVASTQNGPVTRVTPLFVSGRSTITSSSPRRDSHCFGSESSRDVFSPLRKRSKKP